MSLKGRLFQKLFHNYMVLLHLSVQRTNLIYASNIILEKMRIVDRLIRIFSIYCADKHTGRPRSSGRENRSRGCGTKGLWKKTSLLFSVLKKIGPHIISLFSFFYLIIIIISIQTLTKIKK